MVEQINIIGCLLTVITRFKQITQSLPHEPHRPRESTCMQCVKPSTIVDGLSTTSEALGQIQIPTLLNPIPTLLNPIPILLNPIPTLIKHLQQIPDTVRY